MLLSVFYEPWIDYNLVTPWLRGTVAAIDSVAHGRPYILGCMLMEREPSVAALWAGAVILGLQHLVLAIAGPSEVLEAINHIFAI